MISIDTTKIFLHPIYTGTSTPKQATTTNEWMKSSFALARS